MSEPIIIVDDDRSVSVSLDRLLAANGFASTTFPSAEALRNSGRIYRARCVILDINLPGASGLEFAREIRKDAARNVGLIFITAYDRTEHRSEASLLGALAYLAKPFSGEKLLTAVRAALYSTGVTIGGQGS